MSTDAFVRHEIPRLSGPADHRERERARREGHALGFAQGLRDAAVQARRDAERADAERRAAAEAEAAAMVATRAAVEAAAASLAVRMDALSALAEERVWELAVELAETILDRELSDPVRAARTALARAERAADAVDAVIVLSPADAAVLDGLGERPTTLTVETSAALSPGDAVVHVPDGQIDLRVNDALARARAALQEASA